MSTRTVDHGGEEYVEATIAADVELHTQTVTLSFDGGTTWLPCTWQGNPDTTRIARTSSVVDVDTVIGDRGIYRLKAKLDTGTEEIIVSCGGIKVV